MIDRDRFRTILNDLEQNKIDNLQLTSECLARDQAWLLCQRIADNASLKKLILLNKNLAPHDIRLLADNNSIVTMDLSSTPICDNKCQCNRNHAKDYGAISFGRNKTIRFLHLGYNDVTDRGVKYLAQNKTLQYLSLEGNKITDQSAQYLAKNSSIKVLDLSFTCVSDKGLMSLVNNRALQMIAIASCQITETGLSHFSRAVLNNRDSRIYIIQIDKIGEFLKPKKDKFLQLADQLLPKFYRKNIDFKQYSEETKIDLLFTVLDAMNNCRYHIMQYFINKDGSYQDKITQVIPPEIGCLILNFVHPQLSNAGVQMAWGSARKRGLEFKKLKNRP